MAMRLRPGAGPGTGSAAPASTVSGSASLSANVAARPIWWASTVAAPSSRATKMPSRTIAAIRLGSDPACSRIAGIDDSGIRDGRSPCRRSSPDTNAGRSSAQTGGTSSSFVRRLRPGCRSRSDGRPASTTAPLRRTTRRHASASSRWASSISNAYERPGRSSPGASSALSVPLRWSVAATDRRMVDLPAPGRPMSTVAARAWTEDTSAACTLSSPGGRIVPGSCGAAPLPRDTSASSCNTLDMADSCTAKGTPAISSDDC